VFPYHPLTDIIYLLVFPPYRIGFYLIDLHPSQWSSLDTPKRLTRRD